MSKVWLLPISCFILFQCTFIGTWVIRNKFVVYQNKYKFFKKNYRYVASIVQNHVVPDVPYISDAATYSPESCIFGQLINTGCVLRNNLFDSIRIFPQIIIFSCLDNLHAIQTNHSFDWSPWSITERHRDIKQKKPLCRTCVLLRNIDCCKFSRDKCSYNALRRSFYLLRNGNSLLLDAVNHILSNRAVHQFKESSGSNNFIDILFDFLRDCSCLWCYFAYPFWRNRS
jgi:hypothetical protein